MILDKDGKEVKITKLPAGPIDPDLHFDRFAFDDAGHAPAITRTNALLNKDFGASPFAEGRRKGASKTE